MPGFDGTGPQGNGPMTGRARGYCMLQKAKDELNDVRGFAGVQGTPVGVESPQGKEVADMPFAYGIGPTVGRPVMYPAPSYGTPVPTRGVPPFGAYGPASYGYGWPWGAGGFVRPWFGRAFGRGRGWGRGRRRFRFPW